MPQHSDSPQGGMYAPLPQSLTDSDSEEELHNSSLHHHHHSSSSHGGGSNNHHHHHKTKKIFNDCGSGGGVSGNATGAGIIGEGTEITIHNHITSDGEEYNGFIGLYTDSDNVAILREPKKEPMSTLRKCCFVLSIQMCILTVVIFIWVLPCSDNFTCPAANERIKTHQWIREYEKIELKGMINIVDGLHGRSKNLAFMYRGDRVFHYNDPRGHGIICLVGSVGEVAWYDEMVNEPTNIDCALFDADKDGSTDCLVTDEYGQLGCISPISGQWLWHVHNQENSTKKRDLLDFPLILPDLNNDGVNELLLASSMGGGRHNNLVIISGSNGSIVGKPTKISECIYIHKLQIDSKFVISFNCVNKQSEFEKFKPLSEIATKVKNFNGKTTATTPTIEQHKFYGQRKNTENQRNIYSVSGKQLIVENRGKCPDNCNVTVTLLDEKNGKDYLLSNATQMYGMVPTKLSFNKTSIESKSDVHGFVIKFWEWNHNETEQKFKSGRLKRDTNTNSDDVDDIQEEEEVFNVFPNIVMRKKRMISLSKSRKFTDNPKSNEKYEFIKESIVLIIFNSTETRIVNTSQSSIIQICQKTNETRVCQPDLNYQENSLLVADLDDDGSQELVSYYTTFLTGEHGEGMKLITYVQLLRLESELPKLYTTEIKEKD